MSTRNAANLSAHLNDVALLARLGFGEMLEQDATDLQDGARMSVQVDVRSVYDNF